MRPIREISGQRLGLFILIAGITATFCTPAFGTPKKATKATAHPSRSAHPNGDQLVEYAENRLEGTTRQAQMQLFVHRHDSDRHLQLRTWAVRDRSTLVEIIDPNREERVSSLWSKAQMWNYLPEVDRVVRVPGSLWFGNWMGTNFTYDDLMTVSSLGRDYRHRLIRRDKVGGDPVWVVECTPKPSAKIAWGRVVYYARIKDWLPIKEEFFDAAGQEVRLLRFGRFQKMDGRIIPGLILAKRLDSPDEWTVMVYQKVLFDRSLNPSVFSHERLRSTVHQNRLLLQSWSEERLSLSDGRDRAGRGVLVSRRP